MRLRFRARGAVPVVAVTALLLAVPADLPAGEFFSQFGVGGSGFFASPPCPMRQFPTFESLAPVPRIIDPFEQDLIPVFCEILVQNGDQPGKKRRGKFESELIVRDNQTGELESFPVGSGRFRTNKDGEASFDFDLPAEIFADGFESGDVSAWSYTRTDFTNRKKASAAQVQCFSSASRSD